MVTLRTKFHRSPYGPPRIHIIHPKQNQKVTILFLSAQLHIRNKTFLLKHKLHTYICIYHMSSLITIQAVYSGTMVTYHTVLYIHRSINSIFWKFSFNKDKIRHRQKHLKIIYILHFALLQHNTVLYCTLHSLHARFLREDETPHLLPVFRVTTLIYFLSLWVVIQQRQRGRQTRFPVVTKTLRIGAFSSDVILFRSDDGMFTTLLLGEEKTLERPSPQ